MNDSLLPSARDRVWCLMKSRRLSEHWAWSVSLHIWAVLLAEQASGQKGVSPSQGQVSFACLVMKHRVKFVLVLRPGRCVGVSAAQVV